MKKTLKVVMLVLSIILFCMQNAVEAKYVFSYENEIAQVYIDNISPIIEGVEENGKYKQDVSITYYDNSQVQKAEYYYNSEKAEFDVEAQSFKSGEIFTKEGYYKIIVTDVYQNKTVIEKILIDKTSPEIKGVENGVIYDIPPNIEYYDKYGIEKIEIITEEELMLEYQYRNSNIKPCSDRTSTTITVNISYSPNEVKEYKWYIKKEAELEYKLVDSNLEECFIFTNLEENTTYNIYCIAITNENKSYMSNLITAKTITNAEKVEIIEVLEYGYKIKVTEIPDNYQYIYFPTWSDQNGQDDVVWYKYELSNNEFLFTLDNNDHNKENGMYHTHIYVQEGEKEMQYVQSTYVWIGQEEPKEETTQLSGNVKVNVTDQAGNQNNVEYFVDKLITINTSKTYGKYVYPKLKNILEGKMESYDDENYIINIKQSELDKIKKVEISNYIDQDDIEFRGINYFRKLEYLDISGSTKFKTDELSTLTNLKYLDISNCQSDYIYDLTFLKQLPNLEYLNTTGTKIINEEIVQTLTNLKEWKNE